MTEKRQPTPVEAMVERFIQEAQLPNQDQAALAAVMEKFHFSGEVRDIGITLNGPVNFYGASRST